MILAENVKELKRALEKLGRAKVSLGFVPTMGALHNGHVSLVERAKSENELVVSSIFVNPTQFNDPNDLLNYPRTPESDTFLLSEAGCDLLFMPTVRDMYPDDTMIDMDFGMLERVMEGNYRPGHFRGVATIVSRFFEMIQPDRAYFGEKDFQQLAIIREMNRRMNTGIKIIGCETLRESDGLAMSSRNIHLTAEERSAAGIIFQTLKGIVDAVRSHSLASVKKEAIAKIESRAGFRVQYLELVDSETLLPIENYESGKEQRVCVAVLTSKTRLIDNMAL